MRYGKGNAQGLARLILKRENNLATGKDYLCPKNNGFDPALAVIHLES